MQPPTDAPALARRLTDAGYTLDAVTDRIGEAATAALARNTTLATRDALGDASDPQAALVRAFLMQDAVPAAALRGALDGPSATSLASASSAASSASAQVPVMR